MTLERLLQEIGMRSFMIFLGVRLVHAQGSDGAWWIRRNPGGGLVRRPWVKKWFGRKEAMALS